MKIEDLKSYYNKIDSCSVALENEISFEYIQEQITKFSIYTESLNRVIGELLVEQTRLEHIITDSRFNYELKFTEFCMNHTKVQEIATAKERKDYVNYFLMKDEYRSLLDLEQEYKDVQRLLDLANKKAKDLDRTYPKLKTLWDSLSSEVKNIKKIGSDMEHIDRVKNKISSEISNHKPVFSDDIVEELSSEQYDKNNNINDNLNKLTDNFNQHNDIDIEDLLKDI